MNEDQVDHLVSQVDRNVDSLSKVKLVRRALKTARFIPGTRKTLTPEVRAIIEEFLSKKEKELS